MIRPGDPGYDEARRGFNAGADGRPAAIVACADADEVARAVAGRAGLTVAVRGGGHSVAGFGSATGALVVDLRRLDAVEVDGDLAWVGGGCTWGRLLGELAPRGLVVSGGFDGRVGVGGLTLGGGYGPLSRAHGLACDNLVAAEVVTADGERRLAGPDLLWALRGAGANFGVVTRLGLRVQAALPLIAGVVAYPLSRTGEVLRVVREVAATLPDSASLYVGLGDVVALMFFQLGEPGPIAGWLAPFRALGQALSTDFRRSSYAERQAQGHDVFPAGHEHAWRSDFVAALDDDVIAALAAHARGMWVVVEHLGGAIARVAPDATAFPHRRAGFGVVSTLSWQGARPESTQAALHEALAHRSIGRYVNYLGRPAAADDVAAAYGQNLPRLRELKRRWDPDNVFRHNVNLVPPP